MLQHELINRDKDILGGTPVFVGTRVPIQTLFDYLEGNHPLEDFLDDFPSVKQSQAQGVLELFKQLLLEGQYESAA